MMSSSDPIAPVQGFMDGLDEDDLADILSDSSSDDETPEGQTKEASE